MSKSKLALKPLNTYILLDKRKFSLNQTLRFTEQCDSGPRGLSSEVVDIPECPVGPGADKQGHYKNPEYYSYHKFSFMQAMVEMMSFRGPQPSSLPKKKAPDPPPASPDAKVK